MSGSGRPSTTSMLAHARAILDGAISVPTAHASRAAAVLGRQAFEDLVRVLCELAGARLERPTMRSRLTILRVLLDRDGLTDLPDVTEAAWSGLSRACHYHAFELTPTTAEVRHLLDRVETIRARVDAYGHQVPGGRSGRSGKLHPDEAGSR